MSECNWLDSKSKRGCQPRGLNVEPIEKFLINKGGYAKPIGLAIKKEYGKRISTREWIKKGQIELNHEPALDEAFGMIGNLRRINRDINQQIKKEANKHLK